MAVYNRIPKMGKVKPDEFVSAVDHMLRFILKHKRLWAIGGFLSLFVAAGLMIGLNKMEAKRQEAFNAKLSAAKQDFKIYDEIAGNEAPFLKPVVTLSQAELAWQKGEPDKAVALLDILISKGEGLTGDYPRFLKAEILEKEGKKEEAAALYQLIAQSKQNELHGQALARLAAMNL